MTSTATTTSVSNKPNSTSSVVPNGTSTTASSSSSPLSTSKTTTKPTSNSSSKLTTSKPKTDVHAPDVASTVNNTAAVPSSSSSSCHPCQVLLPISAVVLVASIAIPLIKGCCNAAREDDEENDVLDTKDEEEGDDENALSNPVWKTLLNILKLSKDDDAEDSKLSQGDSFTPQDYSTSQSM